MARTPTPAPITPNRILRRRAVVERVGLSATTIWRQVNVGEFPAPVRLSRNAVGWRESDIDGWITARTARV